MKKSTLIMMVSIVLAIALGVGGTLAYLVDQDADVNTMTLGSVKIDQQEYERKTDENGEYVTDEDGYVLKEFTQDKPLMPSVGEVTGWDPTVVPFDQIGGEGNMQVLAGKENVVDKFVVVENEGNSDAYVRTLIAYELGDCTYERWNEIFMTSKHNFWSAEEIGVVNINGTDYVVREYVYDRVLEAGAVSRNSLSQVYLKPQATNEDLIALDGNDNGKYDILVISQAVQAQGFKDGETALTAGFGDTDDELAKEWFEALYKEDGTVNDEMIGSPEDGVDDEVPALNGDDPEVTYEIPADAYRVTNGAELVQAVKDGYTTLVLAAGEYTDMTVPATSNLKIYGESKDAVLYTKYNGGEGADYDFDGSTVEFYGVTLSSAQFAHGGNYYPGYARMKGTYNDCVIDGMYVLYGASEFNYCTLNVTGDTYNIWTWGAGTASFDHCTFNTDGKSILMYNSSCDLTVSNCVFNDSEALAPVKAAIETGADNASINHNITATNVEVNGFAVNTTNCNEVTTTLWANKNGMGKDRLNVVVDGVDVY